MQYALTILFIAFRICTPRQFAGNMSSHPAIHILPDCIMPAESLRKGRTNVIPFSRGTDRKMLLQIQIGCDDRPALSGIDIPVKRIGIALGDLGFLVYTEMTNNG